MLISAFIKSSRSSRIGFSAAIVAIVAIAAYSWIVAPHTKYLHAAQQYELVLDNIAKKNQLIKSKEALKKKEVEKLQAQLADVQTSLFTVVEGKRFLSDIEAICNETNCIVYSINFLSGSSGKSSVSVDDRNTIVENRAVVSFVGSYGDIINFLTKLVNRPQKVSIPLFKIFTSDDRSDPLECEIMITIYTISEREVFANEQANIS